MLAQSLTQIHMSVLVKLLLGMLAFNFIVFMHKRILTSVKIYFTDIFEYTETQVNLKEDVEPDIDVDADEDESTKTK